MDININIIFSADKNWATSRNDKPLMTSKEANKHFEKLIHDSIVVMNYSALKSLSEKDLKSEHRKNIVFSKGIVSSNNEIYIVSSIDQLISAIKFLSEETGFDTVSVIGDEKMYELFLPYANKIYLTMWDNNFHKADRFAPNISKSDNWVLASNSRIYSEGAIDYQFITYNNKFPIQLL